MNSLLNQMPSGLACYMKQKGGMDGKTATAGKGQPHAVASALLRGDAD